MQIFFILTQFIFFKIQVMTQLIFFKIQVMILKQVPPITRHQLLTPNEKM